MREGHRELTGRVIVAEEHIRERIAPLLGRVELLDQGRGLVGEPGLSDGFPRRKDNDGGLARVDDGLDERGLGAHEIERVDVDVLACCGVEALP